MKKLLSILFLFCFFIGAVNAQERRQDKNARIKAMRATYITERLNLTVEEAQLFWPIFNEYEAKRRSIQQSFNHKQDIENMSEKEAEDFINQSFAKEQQILDLKRTYFEKFKVAIPINKIAKLPKIEKNFRQELLKRMRHRREGQGRNN